MPIHDWTRAPLGVYHDFHLAWVVELQKALNRLLPSDRYAMIEYAEPDRASEIKFGEGTNLDADEETILGEIRNRVAVRRTDGDGLVAVLEIVPAAAKLNRAVAEGFASQMAAIIRQGISLLLIDILPPTAVVPHGIHDLIASRFGLPFDLPAEAPLAVSAFVTNFALTDELEFRLESTALGRELVDMPLFLDPIHAVHVPLEETYTAAYEGVADRWRRVIEKADPVVRSAGPSERS
ncbi:MAG TPA: hypothetical protein VEA69_05930 [Tepidisphaeraceae bacterium]|nr:hypothetical protein [Tepidisphaeraceae bacterium]